MSITYCFVLQATKIFMPVLYLRIENKNRIIKVCYSKMSKIIIMPNLLYII